MIDRPSKIMFFVLMILVVAEILGAPHHHPVFPWHRVPGFMAGIGLGACLVVVLASKQIGKRFLQRPENFDD